MEIHNPNNTKQINGTTKIRSNGTTYGTMEFVVTHSVTSIETQLKVARPRAGFCSNDKDRLDLFGLNSQSIKWYVGAARLIRVIFRWRRSNAVIC
jgi:hypothetical protein